MNVRTVVRYEPISRIEPVTAPDMIDEYNRYNEGDSDNSRNEKHKESQERYWRNQMIMEQSVQTEVGHNINTFA